MSQQALIVDDEPHIRRVAELAIRAVGCDVTAVCDGQQAWDEIQAHCPDILVSDVQMPHIDGMELVRRIRSRPELANLPIVLLTAKGFELRQSDSALIRTCDIVCKPFSPTALSRRVHELLSKRLAGVAATV